MYLRQRKSQYHGTTGNSARQRDQPWRRKLKEAINIRENRPAIN